MRMSTVGSWERSWVTPCSVPRSAAMPRSLGVRLEEMAASTRSWVRPLRKTSAPSVARRWAMASPMPAVEPVTSAVLPLSWRSIASSDSRERVEVACAVVWARMLPFVRRVYETNDVGSVDAGRRESVGGWSERSDGHGAEECVVTAECAGEAGECRGPVPHDAHFFGGVESGWEADRVRRQCFGALQHLEHECGRKRGAAVDEVGRAAGVADMVSGREVDRLSAGQGRR